VRSGTAISWTDDTARHTVEHHGTGYRNTRDGWNLASQLGIIERFCTAEKI
jgi:hypothetical protein